MQMGSHLPIAPAGLFSTDCGDPAEVPMVPEGVPAAKAARGSSEGSPKGFQTGSPKRPPKRF